MIGSGHAVPDVWQMHVAVGRFLPDDDPRRSPEQHISTITGKPDFQAYRIYRYQGLGIDEDPYELSDIVAEFVAYVKGDCDEIAMSKESFIREQLASVTDSLAKAELRLEAFRSRHPLRRLAWAVDRFRRRLRRKAHTRYTALAVDHGGVPVFLHTHRTNLVARALLEAEAVPGLEGEPVLHVQHLIC